MKASDVLLVMLDAHSLPLSCVHCTPGRRRRRLLLYIAYIYIRPAFASALRNWHLMCEPFICNFGQAANGTREQGGGCTIEHNGGVVSYIAGRPPLLRVLTLTASSLLRKSQRRARALDGTVGAEERSDGKRESGVREEREMLLMSEKRARWFVDD